MSTNPIFAVGTATDPVVERGQRERFERDGYLPLPDFVSAVGLDVLRREVDALRQDATRRDFTMECMGSSPRHMTTMGGQSIVERSLLVPLLYDNISLVAWMRRVTGLRLITVPDAIERYVLNYLEEPGDTHGGHFDDYPVALVVFVEAPDPDAGGLLEYVNEAADLQDLEGDLVRRAHHRAGDAYLLRSDRVAHRVTPLQRSERRVVLNMAYTTREVVVPQTVSANLLYG